MRKAPGNSARDLPIDIDLDFARAARSYAREESDLIFCTQAGFRNLRATNELGHKFAIGFPFLLFVQLLLRRYRIYLCARQWGVWVHHG